MKTKSPSKADIYTRITNQIIADLETGVRPWVKPWDSSHAEGKILKPLRHNGEPYSGINILSLWSSASVQGFASPTWMTFKQAQELKASVRKGEKGSLVVYANKIIRTEETESGEDVERAIPYLKGYTVFNVEQIDGLPEGFNIKLELHFDLVRTMVLYKPLDIVRMPWPLAKKIHPTSIYLRSSRGFWKKRKSQAAW